MILEKTGEYLISGTQKLTVGDRIVAIDGDYAGLKGYIVEIRTNADKETENIGDDIYCCFDIPEDRAKVKLLEEHFSEFYGEPKTIDELSIDLVIMAPKMLRKAEAYE